MTSPGPDLRLALAASDGDVRAFETLVSRHDARLRRQCRAIAGNPHDADDAVQEAWLRALAGIRRFRRGDVSSWLTVIARNEVHRLTTRRRPTTELRLDIGEESPDDDPYERLRGRELMASVTDALRMLPAAQREVVVREAVGESSAEIAAVLGITPGAVRIRRHRARKTLRAALAGTGWPADAAPTPRETFPARPGFSPHTQYHPPATRSITMAIGPNDVNLIAVETNDQDFAAGSNITFKVRAEAGAAIHGTGGQFKVQMTMTDTTNPALVDSQNIVGNYGGADWPAPGLNTFTFVVPGGATAGRIGDILEPQARLISNSAAPFDSSHVVGGTLLVTP